MRESNISSPFALGARSRLSRCPLLRGLKHPAETDSIYKPILPKRLVLEQGVLDIPFQVPEGVLAGFRVGVITLYDSRNWGVLLYSVPADTAEIQQILGNGARLTPHWTARG